MISSTELLFPRWQSRRLPSGCGLFRGTEADTIANQTAPWSEVTSGVPTPTRKLALGRRASSSAAPAQERAPGSRGFSAPKCGMGGVSQSGVSGVPPARAQQRPSNSPRATRGPRAHLIFLTDIDEGRDAHGEDPGTAEAPLPNHADRKRDLSRAAVLYNRFRVTARQPWQGGATEWAGLAVARSRCVGRRG